MPYSIALRNTSSRSIASGSPCGREQRLLLEPLALDHRVVELGVRRRQLDAVDDQVPGLVRGPASLRCGLASGLHGLGVVHRRTSAGSACPRRAARRARRRSPPAPQPAAARRRACRRSSRSVSASVSHVDRRRRRASETRSRIGASRHSPSRSISLPSRAGDDGAADRAVRRRSTSALGQLHHRVLVAVGLVGLEHRELGGVRGVEALVAEGAADLVDPVDAADHRPLLQVPVGTGCCVSAPPRALDV